MKKITIVILIISLTSCNFLFQIYSDKKLTENINSEYLKNKKPINLRKLTNFEWDKFIVIGCYQNIKQIEKENNLDLSNIYYNGIESSDWFELLVFLKDKKSIKICEINMNVNLDLDKSFYFYNSRIQKN